MSKRQDKRRAAHRSKLGPNFPPRLQLTYEDEDGKTVRIIPTLPEAEHEKLTYDPPYLPREY